jgi:hypothetical protein
MQVRLFFTGFDLDFALGNYRSGVDTFINVVKSAAAFFYPGSKRIANCTRSWKEWQ